jgi:Golgi phosphoprotein 3 (GPP34)
LDRRGLGTVTSMVTLAEDLFLLATEASTGRRLIDATHLDLGLGGALLLDLVLQQRIALHDSRVEVTDARPTGDALLDRALSEIVATKSHEPGYWLRHLTHSLRRTVKDRLVDAGVLCRDDHNVLGIIRIHRTHETDGRLHHELDDHLHDAVVQGHPPSQETAALASLALAVGLDRHLFPRSDRRAVRQRMAEVAGECPECEWVADVVHRAVDGVDAALGITPTGQLP